MDAVQKITFDDKVVAGSPGAVEGVTDTMRAEDANAIKSAINKNADILAEQQDSFDTTAAMKAYSETKTMDDGHIVYCVATASYYKYMSSNPNDATTGKFSLVNVDNGVISNTEIDELFT